MNRMTKLTMWTVVSVFIFLISVGSVSAQKVRSSGFPATLAEDTAINPHDFTDDYYELNGIIGKAILDRRTGSDGLSIFSKSSNPFHTDVRVIATLPAYDQNGDMLFWYPLGEIDDSAFTADKLGVEARQLAKLFPVYVFPSAKTEDPRMLTGMRHAALMDNTWAFLTGQELNPLGFREIFLVRFTEKAFTKEGAEVMAYMAKKNGTGSDDTPIIRGMDDLRMMAKLELINTAAFRGEENRYAIAPMIFDPTNGVIAKDAYLLFVTKDGKPLPTESMFAAQFACLQKAGTLCKV